MPYDPMDAGMDWNGTGYGTGDPVSKGFDIAKLMPWIVGGSMAYGAIQPFMGGAASAGSAGTAAHAPTAAGVLPGGAIPGWSEAMAGYAGPTAASAPLGSLGAGSAAGAGAAFGSAGTSIASRFKDWVTDPKNMIGLATMIPALVAQNKAGSMTAQEQALLDEALKRTQRTDPLHQAVTQLAFSRLPDSARQGISLTGK